jgi:DNA-directed RNA polymerase subunit N (RpoN/RPB10)
MRAVRSEDQTSYEKAVYHIERMNVKEKFFGSSVNQARTVIPASGAEPEETLAELGTSRECIKRCVHGKVRQEIRRQFFFARVKVVEKSSASFRRRILTGHTDGNFAPLY